MTEDRGYAPELTGSAKAKQRVDEHGYDQAMHSAPPQQDNPDPGPKHVGHDLPAGKGRGPRSPNSGYASGMEAALAAHADRVHPVKR